MSLSHRDQQVIWHPYTQMKTSAPPVAIVKGEGALLFDENGRSYIDAVSSWWVNIHGHAHPHITKKVSGQLAVLEHVMFAGFTHPTAVELAEQLMPRLPGNQKKLFYSDNGSTAVEVALKMAIQFWHNQGIKKNKILAFEHSYHGDTFGAMSVSSRSAFTAAFDPLLFEVFTIPFPNNPTHTKEALLSILKEHENDIAAFIFEPLILGAGGMLMYEADFLDTLLTCCKENNILCIADEVMTGFGRTGKFFACDHLKNEPDIICLSKGLTGGTMALGITTCKQKIYEAFLSEEKTKTFFHGHSFTANPVACAAAIASLELMNEPQTSESITRISQQHISFANKLKQYSQVQNIRNKGTILAFDIRTGENTSYFHSLRDELYDFFMREGIILRPLGNTLYIMPPYCITQNQLETIYKAIEKYLQLNTAKI